LVEYVTDSQDKDHRVGVVKSVNCHAATIDAAVTEVLATQQQNTRAKGDKTYHLLVSFREGEEIDDDTLSKIESALCESIGFGEHQRISAVHRDTDNLHIHVAINKIHPEKLTMIEPYNAYRTLSNVCERLEIEYDLEKDNHISKVRSGEGRAQDMEAHSGQKSLMSWTREHCGEALQQAQSWQAMHQVLGEHGLHLEKRGNGLVIVSDNGEGIKASSVSRHLSKPALEKRLGEFEAGERLEGVTEHQSRYRKQPISLKIDTTQLYQSYQQNAKQAEQQMQQLLSQVMKEKGRKLKALDFANKLKRFAISQETNFITRRLLYKHHFNAVKRQRKVIQLTANDAKKQVYGQHRQLTWADWLKHEAKQGNKEALTALSARKPDRHQHSNRLSGLVPVVLDSHVLTSSDNITKKGSVIDKGTGIKATGQSLVLPKKLSAMAMLNALELAQARYGNVINVEGSTAFKQLTAKVAVSTHMNIRFTGDAESYRLALEDKANDRQNRRGITARCNDEPGRAVSRRNGHRRRDERGQSQSQRQSHVGSVGLEPPAPRRHRLCHLSELGVASFKGEGAVLLPRDVPGDMEQQRPRGASDALRWGVFGARLDTAQMSAAESYINERLSKRNKGMNIAVHEPLTQAVKGEFAGLRRVDGESLLLIKAAPNVVSVLPIKSDVKRLKIGDKITINNQGKISRSRGSSRER
jgi:hypothetical protein